MIEKYLKELVAFYPVTHKPENVLSLLRYVQEHCAKYGMKAEIVSFNGVHNLYAHPRGSQKSAVMLQAHADVVPTDLNNQKELFSAKGKLYGRGAFDMLFAVACYLHFIAQHSAELTQLDVSLLLSGDEELGGSNGVKKMLDSGYTTGVCILPDAGSEFGVLTTAAKGACMVRVRVNGLAHHGARPWEGDGAAAKLVSFLCEFQKAFDTASYDESSLTIATLQAGDAENLVEHRNDDAAATDAKDPRE